MNISYNKKEKIVIWLSIFEQLTLKKQHQLISLYDNIEKLWQNFETDKNIIVEIVKEEAYNLLFFIVTNVH